jgi:hypothetical protein
MSSQDVTLIVLYAEGRVGMKLEYDLCTSCELFSNKAWLCLTMLITLQYSETILAKLQLYPPATTLIVGSTLASNNFSSIILLELKDECLSLNCCNG